ncbi:uncharacterized protein [Chironomus tepperi]|uniref:uncharacterized protein n=1 Tax=Chironomus tepperi TaxID=113505 RepID=UPI00391F6F38
MKIIAGILIVFGAYYANAKFLEMQRIEVDIDPKYIKVSSHLQKVDNLNVVNLDLDVLQDETDVQYMATVFKENLDHYELVYKSELVSGCTHEEINDPILKFIFKESEKYGNVTQACPLKVGHYTLRGFKIDSEDLPHQLPSGKYRFDFSAFIKMNGFLHEIYTDKYYYLS